MPKILEHLTTYPTYNRYPNEWVEAKSFVEGPKLMASEPWMEEYEMRLISTARYRIMHDYEKSHAEEHAKKRLIAHLYSEQKSLTENAISAISSGASKREVIEILLRLSESMK